MGSGWPKSGPSSGWRWDPFGLMRRAAAVLSALAVCFVGCGAGSPPPRTSTTADDAQFRSLETRSLDLPHFHLKGGFSHGVPGRCFAEVDVGAIGLPSIPGEAALGPWPGEAALRRGPVYMDTLGVPRVTSLKSVPLNEGGRASGLSLLWISRPTYHGPTLVRGRRLDGPGALGFGSGATPSPELRLPAGPWPRTGLRLRGALETTFGRGTVIRGAPGWRVAMVPTRIEKPGCYGVQVDGRGFSYVLSVAVFRVP